jgi:hypothetical protein
MPSELETKLGELCGGLGTRRPNLYHLLGDQLRKLWHISEEDAHNRDLVFRMVQEQLELLIEKLDANRKDVNCRPQDKNIVRVLFNIGIADIEDFDLTNRYKWCDSYKAKNEFGLLPGNTVRGARWRQRIIGTLASDLQKMACSNGLPKRKEIIQRVEANTRGRVLHSLNGKISETAIQSSNSSTSTKAPPKSQTSHHSRTTPSKRKSKKSQASPTYNFNFGTGEQINNTFNDKVKTFIAKQTKTRGQPYSEIETKVDMLLDMLENSKKRQRTPQLAVQGLLLAKRTIVKNQLTQAKEYIEEVAGVLGPDHELSSSMSELLTDLEKFPSEQ